MKSYTDIEQSKKLAKILPIESADMNYWCGTQIRIGGYRTMDKDLDIPCWSLTALLGVLPFIDFTTPQLFGTPKTLYRCMYDNNLKSHAYDNPIDACYDLIITLYEQKML